MSTNIESLECRRMFSVSPHGALVALRSDVAGIGQRIKVITGINSKALSLMHGEVSIFSGTGGTDAANLQAVNAAFVAERATLVTNFDYARVLYGQDVNRLTAAVRAAARHPFNPALSARVTVAENLLIDQGQRALDVLNQNCDALTQTYIDGVAAVAAAHPIDATLADTAANVALAFSQNVQFIQDSTSVIANVDIPDLITAVDPQGSNAE